MGLAAFAGNETAGTFGFAGFGRVLGRRIGVDINGRVIGGTRGEKRVVDIRSGLPGETGKNHGVEGVIGTGDRFGNEATNIGHLRVVENGDGAADVADEITAGIAFAGSSEDDCFIVGAPADLDTKIVLDKAFVGVGGFGGFHRNAKKLIEAFRKWFGLNGPFWFGFSNGKVSGIGSGGGEGDAFFMKIAAEDIGGGIVLFGVGAPDLAGLVSNPFDDAAVIFFLIRGDVVFGS